MHEWLKQARRECPQVHQPVFHTGGGRSPDAIQPEPIQMAQDSSKPEFWETRYLDCVMPWDAGKVPRALVDLLPRLRPGMRILIPGCGSAYEAGFLAQHGMDVLAIDFSPAAVAQARRHLVSFPDVVREADFFEFDSGLPFDLVYERAFLCALPPKMWRAYAQRMAQLVKPGGLLAGFFFFDDSPRGPPFGIGAQALRDLLTPPFALEAELPVQDSIPVFQGKERWLAFRRPAA